MIGETQSDLDNEFGVAVFEDNIERAIQLLDRGANVNARVPEYRQTNRPTVLMVASGQGQKEVVMKLLAGGADVNATDVEHASTALSRASEAGHVEIVAALLEAGADGNARGTGGQTPLMMACIYGQSQVVKLLLDHNANPELRECYDRASARASDPHLYNAEELAARQGHRDIVDMIRQYRRNRKRWWQFWR